MMQSKSLGQPQQLCKCCLNPLLAENRRIQTNRVLCEIFKKLIQGHELTKGSVCVKCYEKLIEYDLFQREIIFKHDTFEQLESGELEESEHEIPINDFKQDDKDPEIKFECKLSEHLTKKSPDMTKNSQEKSSKSSKNSSKLHLDIVKTKSPKKIKQHINQPSASIKPKHSASEFYLLPPRPLVLPKIPSFSKLCQSSSSETLSAEENEITQKSYAHENPPNKNFDHAHVPSTREAIPVNINKNIQMIKCSYCNTIATNRDYIVKHIEEKHHIPCRQNCSKFFKTEKEVDIHMENEHGKSTIVHTETELNESKDDGRQKKLRAMKAKSTYKTQKNKLNLQKGSSTGKSILPD